MSILSKPRIECFHSHLKGNCQYCDAELPHVRWRVRLSRLAEVFCTDTCVRRFEWERQADKAKAAL